MAVEKTGLREKTTEIIKRLLQAYPDAKIALKFSNPLELLVATVLSAQTTDKKVNEVTRRLFEKYRTAEDYAVADLRELEKDLRQLGFFRNKAKNIKASAEIIVKRFGGKVPKTMAELTELPGVARKTANIVLSNAFGVVEGIAVDTHVLRLSQRLGLTTEKDPVRVEKNLMELVPREYWFKFSYLLIDHGRAVCQAKKPTCSRCLLNDLCPSAFQLKNWT